MTLKRFVRSFLMICCWWCWTIIDWVTSNWTTYAPPPSLSHSHVLSFSCGPILMVRNEPSYRILCAEWMKNFTYIQFVVFCSVSIRYANEWWTTPDKCQLNFFFSMFDVSILISIFHSHSFVFIEAITSIIWLNRWETKMTNGETFLWL